MSDGLKPCSFCGGEAVFNAHAGRTYLIEWRDGGTECEGHYRCASCGDDLPRWAELAWDDYQAAHFEGEPPFRHCPNCGAKVMGGEE